MRDTRITALKNSWKQINIHIYNVKSKKCMNILVSA